jgi:hypothetical protein
MLHYYNKLVVSQNINLKAFGPSKQNIQETYLRYQQMARLTKSLKYVAPSNQNQHFSFDWLTKYSYPT